MLRRAAFAGSFYEANPNTIKKNFDLWFKQAVIPQDIQKLYGVICPHAGLMYSGACAAYSYKLLSTFNFRTAIILHPSHRSNHFGFSVSPYDEYETPFGNLSLDSKLAEFIEHKGAQKIDTTDHQNEHSMEVQLPFLAYINPEIKIVPVMLGNQSETVSLELAEILAEIVAAYPEEVGIVISTDLSHYYSAREAERKDKLLIEYLLKLDAEQFIEEIRNRKIEACGFGGVYTIINLAKKIAGSRMIELNYTHSGYVSNDFDQVVGYLSAALVSE
jgi:AmmeMemoRadiSam system protein B